MAKTEYIQANMQVLHDPKYAFEVEERLNDF